MTVFHAAAIGPEGGAVYKRGLRQVQSDLYHDGSPAHLEAIGSLKDGVPWLDVVLGSRVLFSGAWPDSADGEEKCGCRDGWMVFNATPELGYLGQVQRCDTCALISDEKAWALAEAAGYLLDVDGNVLQAPA